MLTKNHRCPQRMNRAGAGTPASSPGRTTSYRSVSDEIFAQTTIIDDDLSIDCEGRLETGPRIFAYYFLCTISLGSFARITYQVLSI
jgi:hypothetical protein